VPAVAQIPEGTSANRTNITKDNAACTFWFNIVLLSAFFVSGIYFLLCFFVLVHGIKSRPAIPNSLGPIYITEDLADQVFFDPKNIYIFFTKFYIDIYIYQGYA
jgi:hypothetical protein